MSEKLKGFTDYDTLGFYDLYPNLPIDITQNHRDLADNVISKLPIEIIENIIYNSEISTNIIFEIISKLYNKNKCIKKEYITQFNERSGVIYKESDDGVIQVKMKTHVYSLFLFKSGLVFKGILENIHNNSGAKIYEFKNNNFRDSYGRKINYQPITKTKETQQKAYRIIKRK